MLTRPDSSVSPQEQAVTRRWRTAFLGFIVFMLAFGALLSQSPSSAQGAPPALVVDRIEGADRFEVAVNISLQAYSSGSSTAFITTGANFPDALSAVPAAVKLGGPLLLTQTDTLPPAVLAEIKRLGATDLVIVGGPNSVSDDVKAALLSEIPQASVTRISGADRYEASRNLAYFSGASAASVAYVATGANFPDALSAGPAAGQAGAAVVLVNGAAPTLDAPSAQILKTDLSVPTVNIAGGPNSVSTGIEAELAQDQTVHRFGGADRFAASLAINADAFPTAGRVFLATGYKFPDALAGGAFAGSVGAPLFVVPSDCVPQGVLDYIAAKNVHRVTLLGGPASLTPDVAALKPCAS
ncbi:cell wall-binding repeat-containing protein [Herbiconiux sp. 11R-BC]|uniref:cell wall-binding repeat-containing protein n=1 Tax=Herbiconiux sp. 11R-BC TaxID=3111637 RepID=UPI003BFBE31B